ncbi:hypothetical protein HD806DRAFT_499646 [Xylariaceae sp. AK1471]|nr:hypothetical protein HD806DRAFT_499646 [Xylariaceae sp. AK1471]
MKPPISSHHIVPTPFLLFVPILISVNLYQLAHFRHPVPSSNSYRRSKMLCSRAAALFFHNTYALSSLYCLSGTPSALLRHIAQLLTPLPLLTQVERETVNCLVHSNGRS